MDFKMASDFDQGSVCGVGGAKAGKLNLDPAGGVPLTKGGAQIGK